MRAFGGNARIRIGPRMKPTKEAIRRQERAARARAEEQAAEANEERVRAVETTKRAMAARMEAEKRLRRLKWAAVVLAAALAIVGLVLILWGGR
jgi:Flp pilus assembly protein TadB